MHPKKGFTLIELSIVLVVIGLIVGGVLVGRDLISTAAARAQISQINTYNAAVNTFHEKYGGIPGDLSVALANQFGFLVPSNCTGQIGGRDGNGLIDGYPTYPLAALMGENALFWSDLNTANLGGIFFAAGNDFTQFINCNNSITVADAGTYLPTGKIGYYTVVHVYETNSANWYLLTNIKNGFIRSNSSVQASATIPVIQAYNIDKKIDDGIPTSGNVQAIYIQGVLTPVTNAVSDTPTTCYNTGSNAYSINYNNGILPNCSLSFKFQ